MIATRSVHVSPKTFQRVPSDHMMQALRWHEREVCGGEKRELGRRRKLTSCWFRYLHEGSSPWLLLGGVRAVGAPRAAEMAAIAVLEPNDTSSSLPYCVYGECVIRSGNDTCALNVIRQ